MFSAMRSSRRKYYSTACPCNKVCRCHHRTGSAWKALLIGVIGLSLAFGILIWGATRPIAKRYVEVNGRMCKLNFKETGHTVTGAVWGHDVAICKD